MTSLKSRSPKLSVAVIGVGYLGKFHVQKYASLANVDLTAVCDINAELCQQVAEQYQCKAMTDYNSLVGCVDAVSIVVPTALHHPVAKVMLENGIHVLLEKPMTSTVEQADELIRIAKAKHCVLQIGHLERFNSTLQALNNVLNNPQFIESFRLAPFKLRGSDVNVILDLMIHDIDIIQSIINSPIVKIDANGATVLSKHTDIANARITFENGCVANVTASRINSKPHRKLRIFQPNSYITLDLQNKKITTYHKGQGEMFPGIPAINATEETFENSDALLDEIKSFLKAIAQKTPPVVSGEEGRRALAIAIDIVNIVTSNGNYNQ